MDNKEKIIRQRLNIESNDYDNYWEQWKHDCIRAHDLASLLDLSYCLHADLQNEEEYLEENDLEMVMIKDLNGIVLYKEVPKK